MRFERERRDPKSERPAGEHWRTRVEHDDEFDAVLVADEKLTSANARAQVLEATTLELTQDGVRWLHATLGELVAQWDRRLEQDGKPLPVVTLAQSSPKNDLDVFDALRCVARDANVVHAIAMDEATNGADVMDAMGPLGESLSRLKRIGGNVVPLRRDDEEDE